MPYTHATRKLGKGAVVGDRRTLLFSKYLLPVVAPASAGYITKVKSWPMYLNDTLGDCVIAGAAHMIQQWNVYAGHPALLTNQQVLVGYEQVGGYQPGNPDTDQGCNMLPALKYWRNTGFGGHKIDAFVQVNLQNSAEVRQAIYLFGNLYLGVQLPLTVANVAVWSVPGIGPVGDGSVGSWGGHCVPIVGYGPTGSTVVTWGEILPMTWNFLRVYADEGYAVLSKDWISANQHAVNGFNYAQLQQDLATI